jgi:predicted DNA-binding protein (MmcQ/YjbR family)
MPNTITELEDISPDMSLVELAKRTQASLNTLNHLLEKNPNLRVADILMPDPNSHEAAVRGVMFDIFHRAAKAMGRNSDKALKGDLSELIKRLAPDMNAYNQTAHVNIQNWIKAEVQKKVDPDLIPATLIMESYRIPELV